MLLHLGQRLKYRLTGGPIFIVSKTTGSPGVKEIRYSEKKNSLVCFETKLLKLFRF